MALFPIACDGRGPAPSRALPREDGLSRSVQKFPVFSPGSSPSTDLTLHPHGGGDAPAAGGRAPQERYTGMRWHVTRHPSQSTSLLLFNSRIPSIAGDTTLRTTMRGKNALRPPGTYLSFMVLFISSQ